MIGVGLLGGSLGLSIKRAGLTGRVAGWVRRPEAVAECASLGVADEYSTDLAPAVADADLVVLCTPIGRMAALAEEMLPHLKPGAIVTDVGSVKATLTRDLEPLFARAEKSILSADTPWPEAKKRASAPPAGTFSRTRSWRSRRRPARTAAP